MISLNIEKTLGFISREKVFAYEPLVKEAQNALEKGTGKGNDFLGWLHLPSSITQEHLEDIKATAQVLRENLILPVVNSLGGLPNGFPMPSIPISFISFRFSTHNGADMRLEYAYDHVVELILQIHPLRS